VNNCTCHDTHRRDDSRAPAFRAPLFPMCIVIEHMRYPRADESGCDPGPAIKLSKSDRDAARERHAQTYAKQLRGKHLTRAEKVALVQLAPFAAPCPRAGTPPRCGRTVRL
jgi:hypothetical protein